MKKLLGLALGGILLALPAAATGSKSEERLRCRLTQKTVAECRCVQQKGGKLLCTLANQTVESCCCEATNSK